MMLYIPGVIANILTYSDRYSRTVYHNHSESRRVNSGGQAAWQLLSAEIGLSIMKAGLSNDALAGDFGDSEGRLVLRQLGLDRL